MYAIRSYYATIAGSANVIIGGGGQSAAAAAINQSGQIGPTIRVRQGEPIRVFTAKDLDSYNFV